MAIVFFTNGANLLFIFISRIVECASKKKAKKSARLYHHRLSFKFNNSEFSKSASISEFERPSEAFACSTMKTHAFPTP